MSPKPHQDGHACDADVIVIGAGVNGLTCAAMLAQPRRRVLVLEAADAIGGLSVVKEIVPGFRAPAFASWAGPVDPTIVKALKLQKHGLTQGVPRLGVIALAEDGRHMFLDSHMRRGATGIAQTSQADAKTWPVFDAAMRKLAAGLAEWASEPPLSQAAQGRAGGTARIRNDEAARAGVAGLALRSIAALTGEYFESSTLQSAIAFDAVIGSGLGPRTPGSALLWLEKLAHETVRPETAIHYLGGPAALASALSQAAQTAGAMVRVNAEVTDLVLETGRIQGVVLRSGQKLFAPMVVSSPSPTSVLRWPALRRGLSAGWDRALPGAARPHAMAKVQLALRGLPQFKGLEPRDLKARLLITGGLEALQRNYDQAVEGVLGDALAMEVTLASAYDETLAPKDAHILSALVAFVPVAPEGGWAASSQQLALKTISLLGRYAPDLPSRVLSVSVEDPESIARVTGDILWRAPGQGPLHPENPYGGPVEGLYFCGAGTHPRAGLSGLNGRNCAEALLASSLRFKDAPA
jgi:phytoene dehydrogenase-like protein